MPGEVHQDTPWDPTQTAKRGSVCKTSSRVFIDFQRKADSIFDRDRSRASLVYIISSLYDGVWCWQGDRAIHTLT
jgi:hypothetical protein